MKKLLRRVLFCLLLSVLIWCGTVVADRQRLNQELIRLHVVANSDSQFDQRMKLQVRDAITESLQGAMERISDVDAARAYLEENLPKIQKIADSVLAEHGCDAKTQVSLCREQFSTRFYDTFSLPAGVYEALRITIGDGRGKNWWCVTFPTLCIPATAEGFSDAAASAGFPETLNETLTGEDGYEIRFFLLDAMGELENIFFPG